MTRPLFGSAEWRRARAALEDTGRRVLLALDLDGTLAPLAPHPAQARVPAATLRRVERAARGLNLQVAVLSARSYKDLRRLCPVRRVLRIGQYGLEGPLAPPRAVRAGIRRRCAVVTRALRPLVTPVPGALLEPKGLTVGVHSRNVSAAAARRTLVRGVRRVESNEAREVDFVTMPGAEIVDFVPRGYDKGVVMRALRAMFRPSVIFYFGDSGGDEPAFRALGRADFPVKVGRGATHARTRVAGLGQVTRFLDAVTALRADPA